MAAGEVPEEPDAHLRALPGGHIQEFPSVKERFDLRRSSRSSLIAQLIREGKASGAFSSTVDAEAFTLLFMGGLRLAVLEWRHANFSYDLREKAPPMLGMLRRCLEAEG